MNTAPSILPTILGLQPYEWLTLAGILIGPIIAVVLTLGVEARRRSNDQKVQVLRMLLSTRHLPGDAAYSLAINLIPVEFNKSAAVMHAWNDYIGAVQFQPSPENMDRVLQNSSAKQTRLIYEIARSLGFNLAETDIQTSAYASEGWVKREALILDGHAAWREIADALKVQTSIMIQDRPAEPLPPLVEERKKK